MAEYCANSVAAMVPAECVSATVLAATVATIEGILKMDVSS